MEYTLDTINRDTLLLTHDVMMPQDSPRPDIEEVNLNEPPLSPNNPIQDGWALEETVPTNLTKFQPQQKLRAEFLNCGTLHTGNYD
jgi:hypothetical protein